MKIVAVQDMHVAGGFRGNLSFLKLETDDGIVGWSEYNEEYQVPGMPLFVGLTMIIRQLARRIIGSDPRDINAIEVTLRGGHFRPHHGLEHYAIAALVNGCLDIKAKALNLRVCDLFGGAIREELPVYWSHCGTYRAIYSDCLDVPAVATLDDVRALGQEVRTRSFTALKTNEIMEYLRPSPPTFGSRLLRSYPARVAAQGLAEGAVELMEAFREGTLGEVQLALDVNSMLRVADIRALAKALEPFDLLWLELDNIPAPELGRLRWATSTRIGSLETVLGVQDILPFLQASSVDICIIDAQHNGLPEALRMAAVADAFDVNVAPHNAYSGLSILFGAHFAALIPNLAIMEFDVDQPRWMEDVLSHPPTVTNGRFVMPQEPGWGTDIVEEAVLANPPADNAAAPWLLDYHRKAGAI